MTGERKRENKSDPKIYSAKQDKPVDIFNKPTVNFREFYVEKRPDHGENQIKDVGELVPGMKVIEVSHLNKKDEPKKSEPKTIVKGPYKALNNLWVDIQEEVEGKMLVLTTSIADRSVIPYGDGLWNNVNWFERVVEEPKS